MIKKVHERQNIERTLLIHNCEPFSKVKKLEAHKDKINDKIHDSEIRNEKLGIKVGKDNYHSERRLCSTWCKS